MFKRLSRTKVYESPWINLYTDKVQLPSGKIIEKYHYLDHQKQSVIVVLVNNKNEICFIRSLRYISKKEDCLEWELPAGYIEEGEAVIDAAKREVLEETGFEVLNSEKGYEFNPSNGMSNQKVHVVFALTKRDDQKKFDTDEVKQVYWFSKEKAKSLIDNKEIEDGVSLIGLFLYLNKDDSLTLK